MNRISLTHYERRPRSAGNYSLEAIFQDVRQRLEQQADITARVAPAYSNGLLPRLRILLDAWLHRRELLHFTGDIHFAAIVARRKGSILTIHDCGGLVNKQGYRAALMKLLWYKLPVNRVSHVTTVSEASKRDIIAITGCSSSKITVIRNAVSERMVHCDKPFNSHRPRILQVGTSVNKNIERLAQALANIPCQLVVIGELMHRNEQRSTIPVFHVKTT